MGSPPSIRTVGLAPLQPRPAVLAPRRASLHQRTWLDFVRSVLELAGDASRPLFERLRFLALSSQSLDEYFEASAGTANPRPSSLPSLRARVLELTRLQEAILLEQMLPRLESRGISVASWSSLPALERRALSRQFRLRILPLLTPLAVDPAHPFPYLPNLSLNLAVLIRERASQSRRFAHVKVPADLPRFLHESGGHLVPVEEVIVAHLRMLFPGTEIESCDRFRVTRASGSPVRIETNDSMSVPVQAWILSELGLDERDAYPTRGLLDLARLWELYGAAAL